jgi:hypothetical protein
MHIKYRQDNFASYDMIHSYVQDNGHELTIYVNSIVKCVYYVGLGSNGCFITGATLAGGHYMMYIISGVG